MALTKDQKAAQLADIKNKLEKSNSVIFAHYIGLTVAEVGDFRAQLKEQNAEMKVGKKTLLKIAMRELKLPEPSEEDLNGPVACIFSYEDPISGAQIARTFSKNYDHVALIGGLFEGKLLSKEQAEEFSKIPGRDILLATFAMMIRSPLVQFASACSSPLSGFARALSELAEKGGTNPNANAKTINEKEEIKEKEEAPKAEATQEVKAEEQKTTKEAGDAKETEESSDSPESSESSEEEPPNPQ